MITVGRNTRMENPMFHIIGSNNSIIIGEECHIGKKCSIWIEGNNITISIGNKTTFTAMVHINAQEENSYIRIGEDCMFSNHIIVRTSDAHPIYDLKTNKRINKPESISIGNHVWVAPDSKIMKGVKINDGSIIGSNTMVTKSIPKNVLAVGMPAKVIKENIKWTREDVLFNTI